MTAPTHYHVDVFAGPAGKYVNGPHLVPIDATGVKWQAVDADGMFGPRDSVLVEATALTTALQECLRLLAARLEKPLLPVWGSAPFDVLGYVRPSTIGMFGLRVWDADNYDRTQNIIGDNGLPSKRGAP